MPVARIDIAPFKGNHFAAPQTCITAKQHDEMRLGVDQRAASSKRSYSAKS